MQKQNSSIDHVLAPEFASFVGLMSRRVAMNGLAIFGLLLILFVFCQISAFRFEIADLINLRVYYLSIVVNSVTAVELLVSNLLYRFWRNRPNADVLTYRLLIINIIVLLAVTFFHVHTMGSQNSLHHLLTVAMLLVVSWFLRWRDVIFFYIGANVFLALIILLEYSGTLPYAPLMQRGDLLAEIFLDWRIVVGQSFNYLLVLAASTILIWWLRRKLEQIENERQQLIDQLRESLAQVKTLSGLLPICANCKNVRDDKGYWTRIENYLRDHAPDVDFTHAICPDCAKKLYPEEILED